MTTTPPAEVTATEFRNDIARIFRDAHYGHPITITNNGEPFVKVVPPDADEGELLTRAEQAEAAIERVRALHKLVREDIAVCDHCDEYLPCPTLRALENIEETS